MLKITNNQLHPPTKQKSQTSKGSLNLASSKASALPKEQFCKLQKTALIQKLELMLSRNLKPDSQIQSNSNLRSLNFRDLI